MQHRQHWSYYWSQGLSNCTSHTWWWFLGKWPFLWRNQMGKQVDFLFTVTVGVPCWGLGEHEPLIITFFKPIVLRRNQKVPSTISGSGQGRGAGRAFELECKWEWQQAGPVEMEGKLQKVSEKFSETSRDILRKFFFRPQIIPSMPEGVVRRLLRRTSEG